VQVCDREGQLLRLAADGVQVSGEPAWLVAGERSRPVVSWAGPWPVVESWWDKKASADRSRLQLLDRDGVGWLVSHDNIAQTWQLEARYD